MSQRGARTWYPSRAARREISCESLIIIPSGTTTFTWNPIRIHGVVVAIYIYMGEMGHAEAHRSFMEHLLPILVKPTRARSRKLSPSFASLSLGSFAWRCSTTTPYIILSAIPPLPASRARPLRPKWIRMRRIYNIFSSLPRNFFLFTPKRER